MSGWAASQPHVGRRDAAQRDAAALGIVSSDEMTWAPLHCMDMQRRHHFFVSAESRAGLALPLSTRTRTLRRQTIRRKTVRTQTVQRRNAYAPHTFTHIAFVKRIATVTHIAVVQTCHAHSVNVPRSTSADRHRRSTSVDHRQSQRSSACTTHVCLDPQSLEIFSDRCCGPACGARRKRTTLNSTRNEISRGSSHADRM